MVKDIKVHMLQGLQLSGQYFSFMYLRYFPLATGRKNFEVDFGLHVSCPIVIADPCLTMWITHRLTKTIDRKL